MAKKPSWLSSREAAALLDVKLETLYAYTSRGLVESVPGPRGRGRRYARESVERLKHRHDARAGHAAVAASALRFGEPSIETSISEIREDGPAYRWHPVLSLCQQDLPFEAVFDLLVAGELTRDTSWSKRSSPQPPMAAAALDVIDDSVRGSASPSAQLAALVALIGLGDAERHGASEAAEHERARSLTVWLAARAGTRRSRLRRARIAEHVLRSLSGRSDAYAASVIDRVLILCADHELNASTFAGRVAASTGADLYACLAAAMHTLSGGRHGGASARVEAFLREIEQPEQAAAVLAERFARGEHVPGFGHPIYTQGDPRACALLELAADAARRTRVATPDYDRMLALCAAMERSGHPRPNLDAGLVAVACALGLPRGSAAAMFAIGRIAGWVAHILEQRRQRYIVRPRARYVPAAAADGGR
jgi:citrate synthase